MMSMPYMPTLPDGMLHIMAELRKTGGIYDKTRGGQWVPGEEERIELRGVVLPVSDKDLKYGLTGTFGQLSEKIYTNGHALTIGGQVFDPQTGITYTVKQELGHNSLHPMKRYLVEAKGGAAEK